MNTELKCLSSSALFLEGHWWFLSSCGIAEYGTQQRVWVTASGPAIELPN